MIINCPVCSTKFKLAEERIPAGGAKVRCSKCQHIFFIPKEQVVTAEPLGVETSASSSQISIKPKRKVRAFSPPISSIARMSWKFLLLVFLLGLAIYGLGQLGQSNFIKERGNHFFSWLSSYLGFKKRAQGFISLEKIRGYYLENSHLQRIFVVEGEAVNRWNEPRSFIKVKGTLLNDQGGKIEERSSYCGNILLEEDLKKFPAQAIEKSLAAQFGETFANVNIPPGQAVPFMIVFMDFNKLQKMDEKVANFQVEVIGSQKGN